MSAPNKHFTFLIDNCYYADSLYWLISSCINSGCHVSIISTKSIFDYLIKEYFSSNPSCGLIKHIQFNYTIKVRNAFEAFARELLTPPSFSLYYQHVYRYRFPFLRPLAKFLYSLPFCKSRLVPNRLLSLFRNVFLRPPLKNHVVVSMTLSPLLCIVADSCRLILVEESWDHFSKYPYGHCPDTYFAWSHFTKLLVTKYQNLFNVTCTTAWKLSYTLNHNQRRGKSICTQLNILYPATFSCNSTGSLMFSEDNLVHSINASLNTTIKDYTLYLKPKPNGTIKDFATSLNQKNCIILNESQFQEVGNRNYKLNNNYNHYRLRLLNNIDIVISLATTFAIECAHVGLPVLLIDPAILPDSLRQSIASRDHLVSLYKSIEQSFIPFYNPCSLLSLDELYTNGHLVSSHLRSIFPIQDPSSLSDSLIPSMTSL